MTVRLMPRASLRLPRLVVAGRRRPVAAAQERALRMIGVDRAGEVRQVILLPRVLLLDVLGPGRVLHRVVEPAVPGRGDAARLGLAVVDDPAPLATELA